MQKIFDELQYAEKLLVAPINDRLIGRDLKILAKYFRNKGLNNSSIRDKLNKYCLDKIKFYNEDIHFKYIENAIIYSKNQNLRIPVPVPITRKEIDKIMSIEEERIQKILFVLLVVSRYYLLTNVNKKDGENIRISRDREFANITLIELYRLAHLCSNKTERENVFNKLCSDGFINELEKNESLVLTYASNNFDNEECEILVENINDIISYFPFFCKSCGVRMIKKNNKHKYCCSCWKKMEKKRVR